MLDLQKEQEQERMRVENRNFFKATAPVSDAGYATPVILIQGKRTERDIER
jgi:hypothetical protein